MELNPSQFAVYMLIKRYVDRQTIVRDAMSELRPDLLVVVADEKSYDRLFELTKIHSNTPQQGYWGENHEWLYFIHGKGCKLIHTISEEPIEWDDPDIQKFDAFWFLNYLQWMIDRGSGNKDVSIITSLLPSYGSRMQDLVFDILNQLVQKNLLVHDDMTNPNKYTVLSTVLVDE